MMSPEDVRVVVLMEAGQLRKRKYVKGSTKGSAQKVIGANFGCFGCGKFGHGIHICRDRKNQDVSSPASPPGPSGSGGS